MNKNDNAITHLRQAGEETRRALSDARRNLSVAQAAYEKAWKAERAVFLAYVARWEQSTEEGIEAMTKEELGSELLDAQAMVLGALSLLEETPPEERSEEAIAAWTLLRRANGILVGAIEVA